MLLVSDFLEKVAKPMGKAAKVGPIGLDFGMDSINLCQLRALANNRYAVIAKASLPFSGGLSELIRTPKSLERLLSTALKKNGGDPSGH